MTRWRHGASILLLSIVLLAGCRSGKTSERSGTLSVTVSIPPQKYFVDRVGGEYVHVSVMVEPGASPATYEPKPEQLTALSEADAYVSIGVPFEKAWLDRFRSVNPAMLMVDSAAGIKRLSMGGGEDNPDPHIWLSPQLVKVQAQNIYSALVEIDPAHEKSYRANLNSFIVDVDALDADIRETLEGVENREFLVFHPSWGYFAQDYGLEMIPIEVGGQEPSAVELAELIAEAQKRNIKVIFAQPEFSTKAADTIADEIGGEVLLISPLASGWLDNMRRVAETFAEVLDQ